MRRHNAILQTTLNVDNEMINWDVETPALSCAKQIKLVYCAKDKGGDGTHQRVLDIGYVMICMGILFPALFCPNLY